MRNFNYYIKHPFEIIDIRQGGLSVHGMIFAGVIAVYFLTPVFRKSQYEERRENLRKREAAFKSSRIKNDTAGVFAETNTDEAEQVMPTSEVTETTEN